MGAPVLILKAKDYGRLTLEERTDHNGNQVHRWIDPEKDRDQGRNKGQQHLFDMEAADNAHEGKHRGYHDKLEEDSDRYLIKPLVARFTELAPEHGKLLDWKYRHYPFDRETKELDIDIDYETAKYMKQQRESPMRREEIQAEYDEKVGPLKKKINERKRKMLKVEKGQTVQFHDGSTALVERFNKSGYPVVNLDGEKTKTIFYEEIKP